MEPLAKRKTCPKIRLLESRNKFDLAWLKKCSLKTMTQNAKEKKNIYIYIYIKFWSSKEETPMTMEKKHEMENKIVGRRRKIFQDWWKIRRPGSNIALGIVKKVVSTFLRKMRRHDTTWSNDWSMETWWKKDFYLFWERVSTYSVRFW